MPIIIDCISDLHGHFPELEGGDLLIVAGDLTATDTFPEYFKFFHWIANTKYKKRIVICGNHDTWAQTELNLMTLPNGDFEYLCDSGTEFEGLKIWGSPWSLTFPNMNPKCKAFTVDTEEELAEKFNLIPDDTDILVTHSPPWGGLDMNCKEIRCGSSSLLDSISRIQPALHAYGHLHESYGKSEECFVRFRPEHKIKRPHISVNASYVNERYEPLNKPIRVIF